MDERAMHGLRSGMAALIALLMVGCGGGSGGGTAAPVVAGSAASGASGDSEANTESPRPGEPGDSVEVEAGGDNGGVDGNGSDPAAGDAADGVGEASGSGDGEGAGGNATNGADPDASGTGDPLDPLILLGDDAALLSRIPEVVETVTLADSGLRVAYTAESQKQLFEPAYLEAQWSWMQECTGVTAMPPLVVVVEGVVRPFVATDDVIRDISGAVQATTSVTAAGSVVQVSDTDFDGSLGTRGFLVRAMLGRMLWIGDGLAERDYPFDCPRRDPTEPAAAISQTPVAR